VAIFQRRIEVVSWEEEQGRLTQEARLHAASPEEVARAGDNGSGRIYRSIGKISFEDDSVNYDVCSLGSSSMTLRSGAMGISLLLILLRTHVGQEGKRREDPEGLVDG
jgi:hypothetical protein